jgi:hypothetical protein
MIGIGLLSEQPSSWSTIPAPHLGAIPHRRSVPLISLSLRGCPTKTGPGTEAKPGHALGFASPLVSSLRLCSHPLTTSRQAAMTAVRSKSSLRIPFPRQERNHKPSSLPLSLYFPATLRENRGLVNRTGV